MSPWGQPRIERTSMHVKHGPGKGEVHGAFEENAVWAEPSS
jgi:hypothetical protein